jgi:hypothetical protein
MDTQAKHCHVEPSGRRDFAIGKPPNVILESKEIDPAVLFGRDAVFSEHAGTEP